jgi:uncharacterized membrane protein
MQNETQQETNQQTTKPTATILLTAGAIIFVTGLILIITATVQNSSFSGNGIIIIGPIPITLGSGPNAQWLTLFAVALTALCITATLILQRKPKSKKT